MDEPVPLRRTAWAVLFGWGYGLLVAFTGAILLIIGLAQGDSALVTGAAVCGAVWALEFFRSVQIRSGALSVRRLLVADERLPISEIVLVEVGRRHEIGWPGYRGYVLAVECPGRRSVIGPSHYCGRRRLEHWANIISEHPEFYGTVRSTADVIDGNS